jgi:pimeloyl-ACP methyl ester carboxylesterase
MAQHAVCFDLLRMSNICPTERSTRQTWITNESAAGHWRRPSLQWPSRRAALLVRPGAAFHEGQVPFGFARRYKVTAPVLVVHGDEDTVVPITLGERLYAKIQAPKHFVRLAGGGHSDLGARAVAAAKRFVAES